jgi:TRAP-type C4-dicarboxylate transport system permease small subunit
LEKAYAMWRGFQERLLGPAASVLMVICTVLALVEVFRRYVVGASYEWQQDAVTYFILCAVFLFFGISQRRGTHLEVALLTALLESRGPRGRRASDVVRLIALVLSFFFLIGVCWWGIPEITDSYQYESRTESLAFPMWPFLTTLLVGFAFMAVSIFFQIYRAFQKLRGRTVLEEPADSGAGAFH